MAAHRLPRPWDSPGKNTGVGCHFLLQCLKVKSEREVSQSCLLATPRTAAYQAPPSMGFSRQEYWSGVPSPSPGKGLGAVKSTTWKNILKTRCWSTDVTDEKPLVTVPVTRALRGLLRKVITSKGLNRVMKGLKVWHWGLCIVYLYPWYEIVKHRYL